MQLASGSHIPDGLLAANALLSEKLHQGFAAPKSTLHQGFGVSISSTPLGIIRPLYDDGTGSRSTGKERDTESGNDYFGARYYASSMGRFMSPDPMTEFDTSDPQKLNRYTYGENNPEKNIDVDGRCVAPAVGAGHVGICVESYIQAARFGLGHLGKGDNRGPVANDPNATFRTQTLINVDLGSGAVSEKSTAGMSDFTVGSLKGVVHDGLSGQSVDKNGNITFTLTVYGENGAEAAGLPGAPGGWIEMTFKILVSPDGSVHVLSDSTKPFPSISIYSYDSNGNSSDIWQQTESGNIDDLQNKRSTPGNGRRTGSNEAKEGAARLCALGNPAACEQ